MEGERWKEEESREGDEVVEQKEREELEEEGEVRLY